MGEHKLSSEFIMYVKTHCPFCYKAEQLLIAENINRKVIPFDDSPDMLEHMKWAYSHSTVPMIFHKNETEIKFVGGYTDLVSYLKELHESEEPNATDS